MSKLKMRLPSFMPVVAAYLALLASPALATVPTGTLTFVTPTGVVGPTDDIPVYLKLTLDADSVPMTTLDYLVTSGFDDLDVSAAGFDPTVIYSKQFSEELNCAGTFTTGCSGPPYSYEFNYVDSMATPRDLDLEPGQSKTFLFLTYHPSNGPVAAGTYTLFDAAVTVAFFDNDPNNPYHRVRLFSTCESQDPSCAFTRTVVGQSGAPGVPEPESWILMIAGFCAVGIVARRNRGNGATASG